MANVLSKSLRTLRKSLGHGVQMLSNALSADETSGADNKAAEKLVEVSEKVEGSEAKNNADQKSQEPKPLPTFRIQAYEKGIWAVCSSCGSLHPLDAVCHACGKPLCKDTHCRTIKRHPHIKRDVIVCNACKDTI